jgi:HipA-like protein
MIKLLDVYWNNIIIGYLYKDKDNYYIFKYDKQNLKTAREKGFDYIIGFKNVNKVYKSDSLFAFFTSRVPSKRRKDVLDRIGISE